MRTLKAAAAVLATTLLLAACGSGGSGSASSSAAAGADAEIVIGSTNEPTGLVRNVGGSSGVSQTMTRNVFEGLTSVDVAGEVVPTLAKDWDVSEDGLVYTFHLQPGVTFHDGSALSAQDVVWSISQTIAPESKSARKNDLSVISAITAPDDATVQLDLSRRSQSLPFYLASVTIVRDGDTELTSDNGTGPYRFVEWTQGDHLTIERNDAYWGEPAKNSGVTFRFFQDTTALNNALLTGDLDLVIAEDSPDQLLQFEGNDEFTITEGTSTTKQIWAFNDRVAPFDDVRVRQALYQAIDREKILDAVWDGRGQVIGSMVPPTDPWFVDQADVHAYDPQVAKDLLAQAGVSGLSIAVDYVAGDPSETIAQLLQADLKAVGVTLTLNPVDDATWYQKIYTDHDFQTTLMGHVNPRDVVWYANPDFYWGYDNKDVQQWVADADQAATTDEQTALLTQVNETIGQEAASAWLYLDPQIRVARAEITGFPVNQVTESFYVADIVREG
ncbi:ABC transporter substrate-binding protein [Oerskovia paurometabola]|uniref:ABC transporter substrate-binding protein n=1 Tax=Oerskovia paurometabola TaxID=162170 RepID=A0ABW1X3T3_9CELL|nr:ABC transporter substrate-binding protein [Oerskovia paurometabola]MBM7498478.1 peptide/nickel transport system substrate-binding protein [Oerskovia paurometabola]